MRALSIASTGMLAQQTNVEVIANNLANMNTTGFKQQRAEFQDLLYQNIVTPGAQTSDTGTYAPSGIQVGAGVRLAAVYRVTTQGDFKSTSLKGIRATIPLRGLNGPRLVRDWLVIKAVTRLANKSTQVCRRTLMFQLTETKL